MPNPTGRTVSKFVRFYANGYDLSGDTRGVGPLKFGMAQVDNSAFPDQIKGYYPGQATIDPGTLNTNFNNATNRSLPVGNTGNGTMQTVIIPIGIQENPAAGDPVFMGQFEQLTFDTVIDKAGGITATLNMAAASGRAAYTNYANPWGILVLEKSTKSAANTAIGIDMLSPDLGGHGGYMIYQIFDAAGAGNMTATIKVQDASTNLNASFGDLLSSGVINCGSGGVAVPTSGIVALSNTATSKQFIRWQIAFGTATSLTLAVAFCRMPFVAPPLVLLHFNGANGSTIVADETQRIWTASGTFTLSNSGPKFGSAAGDFPVGDSPYISTPMTADLDFGSNDFTFEFWAKRGAGLQGHEGIYSSKIVNNATDGIIIRAVPFDDFKLQVVRAWGLTHEDVIVSSSIDLPLSTWTNVRIVRYGNTLTIYFAGVSVGSADVTGLTFHQAQSPIVVIGQEYTDFGPSLHDCQIDEFTIWNTALCTGNFTPPTGEYGLM